MDLALPAFQSSDNGASELTFLRLIPHHHHAMSGNRDPVYVVASLEWETRCGAAVPGPVRTSAQKAWDAHVSKASFTTVSHQLQYSVYLMHGRFEAGGGWYQNTLNSIKFPIVISPNVNLPNAIWPNGVARNKGVLPFRTEI